MDDAHDGPYAREPQVEDLARICQALNDAGARYILIGGFAVIAHGSVRITKDIDLLVGASRDKVARIGQALRILEDRAVDEVTDTDVARYADLQHEYRGEQDPRSIIRRDPAHVRSLFRVARSDVVQRLDA